MALHRAVHLARTRPDARLLLTTFSDTLANALATRLRRLIGNEPRLAERLEIHGMNAIGERLYRLHYGPLRLASPDEVRNAIALALEEVKRGGDLVTVKFNLNFVLGEWRELVDAWQLKDWESYRDVKRLGRKTRLSETQRVALWRVFEQAECRLE